MSEISDRVDAIFSEWNKTNSPGCALAVVRDGEIIYSRGYGMANLDYDLAIRPNSVFHIASISKQFTAFAIALLDQDGKLSIDDDIRDYLAEMPDFGQKISIRQLAHHTSGLRDQWDLFHLAGWRDNDIKTNDDVLYLASRQTDLNFQPNEEYLYSNTGYTLMAIIVERVSGQTFREFTHERIFKPLGMNDTHFHDDFDMIVKNRAYGYVPSKDGGFKISIPLFDTVGATSLFSTVEDLARWERNFYHKKIGGDALIELMLKSAVLNNGETIDYAFGISNSTYRGLKTFGHSGADAGYRSDFLCFPEQNFAVIIFCNLGPMVPSELTKRVADIYLESEFKENLPDHEAITLNDGDLADKLGIYRDPLTGGARKFGSRDGKLYLQVMTDYQFAMQAISVNHFIGQKFPINLEFVNDNEKRGFYESFGSGKSTLYERVDVVDVATLNFEELVGTYFSKELNSEYVVEKGEDGILLKHYKHQAMPFVPTTHDEFMGLGSLQFTRNSSGEIDGFTWFTGRVRKLRFARSD